MDKTLKDIQIHHQEYIEILKLLTYRTSSSLYKQDVEGCTPFSKAVDLNNFVAGYFLAESFLQCLEQSIAVGEDIYYMCPQSNRKLYYQYLYLRYPELLANKNKEGEACYKDILSGSHFKPKVKEYVNQVRLLFPFLLSEYPITLDILEAGFSEVAVNLDLLEKGLWLRGTTPEFAEEKSIQIQDLIPQLKDRFLTHIVVGAIIEVYKKHIALCDTTASIEKLIEQAKNSLVDKNQSQRETIKSQFYLSTIEGKGTLADKFYSDLGEIWFRVHPVTRNFTTSPQDFWEDLMKFAPFYKKRFKEQGY